MLPHTSCAARVAGTWQGAWSISLRLGIGSALDDIQICLKSGGGTWQMGMSF
jgi:hypothetical protein